MNHLHEILKRFPQELLIISILVTLYAYVNGTYINFLISLATTVCLTNNLGKHVHTMLIMTLLQIQIVLIIGSTGPHLFQCEFLNPTKIQTQFGFLIFTFISNWVNCLIVGLYLYKNKKRAVLPTSKLLYIFLFICCIILILYLRNCLTVYQCTNWAIAGILFLQFFSNAIISLIYFYLQ